ncbi:MAG: TonB-dependent receptor, partial [Gammaproteobacteria bacterium]
LEEVARFHERVSINASYSYTHSEVTRSNGPDLGKELPVVPKNKLSFFADYTQQTGPLAGLGGGVGVRYLGASFGDPANTLETGAETLLDALIHYNWRHWELAVNASNLTDKIYVQRCSSLDQCFYASRRALFLSAGQKW